MTASRNTILALGLMLLTSAAGKPALGASLLTGSGSSSDTISSASSKTGSDALCNSTGSSGCDAGCASTQVAGDTKFIDLENEPLIRACRPYVQDFCEICQGCTVKADASVLYMHRSSPGSRTLLLDPTTGGDLYDANRLDFLYAAGPRISLTALDCEGWGLEVNYFGIDGWSATNDIPNTALPSGTANLVVDNVTANQISLTDAHFESIARFYSTEINVRRPLFGNFSVLTGFRWLDMTDRYLASGTSAMGNPVSETIATHNHMFGSQIGIDGTLAKEANRWRINGFIKAGTFLNIANQATSLSDPDIPGPGSPAVSNNNAGIAFFGETGVVGYFQITKHLSASGGYQVMFVNNVAQPASQLGSTNLTIPFATVDTSSGLFYHGASAGLEVTW